MDHNNLSEIERLRPAENDTPVRLMMSFAAETKTEEVPDPYYTRDFEQALDLIESASEGVLREYS